MIVVARDVVAIRNGGRLWPLSTGLIPTEEHWAATLGGGAAVAGDVLLIVS